MGNINNKKDYEINEYGEIVRSDISPKLDKIRGRITQPKPGNNPKKGNNYPTYILLILAILLIVGAVVIGFSNRDYSSVNTEKVLVESVSEVKQSTEEEEFTTDYIVKGGEEQECIIKVDYPTGGNTDLVLSIRKWINKTLSSIASENEYMHSMADGNNLVDYYFNVITSGSAENTEIGISKDYETNRYVTYQVSYRLLFSDGEVAFEYSDGATFKKNDGKIMDWDMFVNDNEMQTLMKDGLIATFGKSYVTEDNLSLPKSFPIFLSDGVKFIFRDNEGIGEAIIRIPYSKLKNQMNASLRELIKE